MNYKTYLVARAAGGADALPADEGSDGALAPVEQRSVRVAQLEVSYNAIRGDFQHN